MAPSSLQTLAQPFKLHNALATLPPEILAHICIYLKDLDEPDDIGLHRYDYAPNTSFPLVCRRFRNLELSILSLWTVIIDTMTTDRINLHVARSGALGLKVRLSIHGGSGCLCKKWTLLTRSSHRWSILTVCAYEQQHDCFSTFRDLSLPSLWSLNLVGIDECMLSILSTWSIPCVRAVNSFRLRTLLALPLMQLLTTLKLTHGHARSGVDQLLDFLASTKSSQLTILHLSLYRLRVQGGLPIQYKELILPMLHDLSLRCLVKIQVLEKTALKLMRCIATPNIRFVALVLTKDIADNDALIDCLRSLKNPSLRTVTVQILGDLDGTSQGRIVDAFQENGGGVLQVETSIDGLVFRFWRFCSREEMGST